MRGVLRPARGSPLVLCFQGKYLSCVARRLDTSLHSVRHTDVGVCRREIGLVSSVVSCVFSFHGVKLLCVGTVLHCCSGSLPVVRVYQA